MKLNVYDERNARWAQELSEVSVIMQSNYLDDEAEGSLRFVGDKIRGKNQFACEKYKASLLVGVNKVASAGYEGGEIWSKLTEAFGYEPGQQVNRTLISELYRKGLEEFGLTRFDHPLTNIGEMILHAAVPINSLDKLMKRLLRAYEETTGLTGEAFNSEIRALSDSQVAAKSLDKPTWRFIKQGGDIADDFIDRCIDIIDDMQDGKYDESGGSGLPERVIQRVVEIIQERQKSGSLARNKQGKRLGKPKFRWHQIFTQNELWVEFPQLENLLGAQVDWLIDNQEQTFSAVTLPSLSGSRAFGSHFPVYEPRPVFTLSAQSNHGNSFQPSDNFSWDLPLYKTNEWLLVFDEEGYLIPGTGTLSPGKYLILYPSSISNSSTSLVFDGESQEGRINPPDGWNSAGGLIWKAKTVSLSKAQRISLIASGTVIQSRFVSNLTKPSFDTSFVEVLNAYTTDGRKVLSGLPRIYFPNLDAEDTQWKVQVRDENGLVVHTQGFSDAELDGNLGELDSFEELDGNYVLSISSRRLGLNARANFTIVSHLVVHSEPATRKISKNLGLDVCELNITKGTTVLCHQLEPDEPKFEINNLEFSKETIVIRPDYESIELFNRVSGNRSEWFSPAKCHLEDLGDIELTFNHLGDYSPTLFATWGPHELVQLENQVTKGRIKAYLGSLKDQAQTKGAFDVVVRSADGSFLELLNCYNKKLYEEIDLDFESRALSVKFPGQNAPKKLRLTIYPEFAYWKAPIVIDDFDGMTVLDQSLIKSGHMIAELEIQDRFLKRVEQKKLSMGMNTFRLEVPEIHWGTDVESKVSKWHESGEEPVGVLRVTPEQCWSMYLAEPRIVTKTALSTSQTLALSKIREFCISKLREFPEAALNKYPSNSSAGASYFRHIRQVGMVDKSGLKNSADLKSKISKPLLALMSTNIKDLEGIAPEYMDDVRLFWGLEIPQTSDIDGNPLDVPFDFVLRKKASQLAFAVDSNNPIVFYANPDRIEEYIQRNELPPGKYFDPGTIARIVADLVKDSLRLAELPLIAEFGKLSQALANHDSKFGQTYFDFVSTRAVLSDAALKSVRGAQTRIMNLTALSIRLAMLARLNAENNENALKMWAYKPFGLGLTVSDYFGYLCDELPDLCEHDLVLADLMLQTKGNL